MREKVCLAVLLAVLLSLTVLPSAFADDPGEPDTCRVECLDVTLPERQVIVEVSVYNDEVLGGLAVPLVFGHSPMDVVCDSVSFVGTRTENAEYQGSSIDTTDYQLVFYAIFVESDLFAGDGAVANLYFTTGPDWDSTQCLEIDTAFFPPVTVLEFTLRASGQALYPEFKAGCLGSGVVSVLELVSPLNEADLCSPDTFDLVWSKVGEDFLYTLQYARDSDFTTEVVTISDLDDTAYAVDPPRQEYFWHVKATNLCGKESPYQDQPFGFYVFQSGDANDDGVVDVADVVYIINYLYRQGEEPKPRESGDASCDGIVDVADLIWLVGYLYRAGPSPCCP
jgi:hypothetical protein